MLFFSKENGEIYKAYSNLFGSNDEDMEDEGQDGGTKGDDGRGGEEDEGVDEFVWRWGWIYSVDIVSDTMKLSWHQVMDMNVIEFLNVRCYIKDKADWEKKRADEYKRLHNLK